MGKFGKRAAQIVGRDGDSELAAISFHHFEYRLRGHTVADESVQRVDGTRDPSLGEAGGPNLAIDSRLAQGGMGTDRTRYPCRSDSTITHVRPAA